MVKKLATLLVRAFVALVVLLVAFMVLSGGTDITSPGWWSHAVHNMQHFIDWSHGAATKGTAWVRHHGR